MFALARPSSNRGGIQDRQIICKACYGNQHKMEDAMKSNGKISLWDICFKSFPVILLALIITACVTAREATWKTVPETNIAYERAWSIVVNAVTQHFELEVSDAQSGYLRTGWKITGKDLLGTPIKKSRVHIRVEERSPFKVKVKTEKQEFDPLSEDWVITGDDEKIENEIMSELSGRLRKT